MNFLFYLYKYTKSVQAASDFVPQFVYRFAVDKTHKADTYECIYLSKTLVKVITIK